MNHAHGSPPEYDLAVIGGGINGCGVARDAAGRGLKVLLCEAGDLAGGASSASSKLIHGGLRYLEQREFKLVRAALREREVLLRSAPHLIRPMRFVLPHCAELRPAWMIRAGLLLYDLLGGRRLARSKSIRLDAHQRDAGMRDEFAAGFEYADCATDDARLVVTVAKDARRHGAEIITRALCARARRVNMRWEIDLQLESGASMTRAAKALVNATGPWSAQFLREHAQLAPPPLKLVQGSHIVVKKWFAGGHAYILQHTDRRVIFVLPFERDLAIIGTTELEYRGDPRMARATPQEIAYLCAAVNRYFRIALAPADVVWSFSGVRPLYDDGAESLRTVTRDYVIRLDAPPGAAPLLNIYGGKLTTFRRLAEAAMTRLAEYFPGMQPPWSAAAKLPGGDARGGADALAAHYAFIAAPTRARYLNAYGGDVFDMLRGARAAQDLGAHFGHGLYEIEAAYLCEHECATRAEDILWRRGKLGLYFTRAQTAALQRYLESRRGGDHAHIAARATTAQ
ncbi:MAG: glycerol-3-phosphate dehydrogenase [Gammaproteobacteria bacterium]